MIKDNGSLMYDVIEKMDSMVRLLDHNNNIIYMNQKMRKVFGEGVGKKCYELLCKDGICEQCISAGCLKSGKSKIKNEVVGAKKYRVIASPVQMNAKENYSLEIFQDITEQSRMEAENLKHYNKLREDLKFARQVQSRALPVDDIYWDSLSVASYYYPSEDLGGDIFDVVKINETSSLFYIADVSGHGIRSSLLTIFLRQIIRGLKSEAGNLHVLLDELLENYDELNVKNEQYISILAGVYDKEKKEITFVNAGHNCLPILLKKDGKIDKITIAGMPICGLLKQSNHETVTISVEKGDRILLYTDGITEAYNCHTKKSFNYDGLESILNENKMKNGPDLVRKIIDKVIDFVGSQPQDDIAVLIAEIL
ncbi:MAG: SpoIIE family protein phosphatase [Anaerovorax sp.]|nr:SpoIIE family protein phosphatase [Anaerovorax sp.]